MMNPMLITTLFELLRGDRQGAVLTAEPIVAGPYCVEAMAAHAPGIESEEVYTPGTQVASTYLPGIQSEEVCR